MSRADAEDALIAQMEKSRRSLAKIGDGDWTPQDQEHSALVNCVETLLYELHLEEEFQDE